jgi:hypothetical protein
LNSRRTCGASASCHERQLALKRIIGDIVRDAVAPRIEIEKLRF